MDSLDSIEYEIAGQLRLTDAQFHWSTAAGGDTHQCFRLDIESRAGEHCYFLKQNGSAASEVLRSEYESLAYFVGYPQFNYPLPELFIEQGDNSYLLMEYREQERLSVEAMASLGHMLASQHQVSNSRFGWHEDNFIGSTQQINPWADDWVEFYTKQRLGYQLDLAVNNSLPAGVARRVDRINQNVAVLFAQYQPEPCLLHGDLWAGNAAQSSDDERPLLFDPAPFFGDRECDLAMTELFGGFSEEFYQAYQQTNPLDQGYQKRKPLYQLYHSLNHYNLFGASYLNMVESHLLAIEAEIR